MQNKDFFSGVPIEVREFLLRLLNQNLRQNLSYKQQKTPEGAFHTLNIHQFFNIIFDFLIGCLRLGTGGIQLVQV